MPPEELLAMIRRRPFIPFRIHLTDGTVYEVHHPHLIVPGRTSIIVGFSDTLNERLISRHETVALIHIIRLEPLEASAPTA